MIFRETYNRQNPGETINDYNDRLIRIACLWFMKHLPNETFVFLTDDKANRKLAQKEKIHAFSGLLGYFLEFNFLIFGFCF